MNEHIGNIGHVLIVDDDPDIREILTGYFTDHNVPVSAVSNRYQFDREFMNTHPSLILLDLELGQDDGIDLLRVIRKKSGVPVIIITGQRAGETDRVVGLELGADDYVIKPFSLRELLARVRAVCRRQKMQAARGNRRKRVGYRFGGWRLDCGRRRLIDPTGTQVQIKKSEYTLLMAFLEAPRRPLSREWLLQATRARDDLLDRSMDVRVLRLRRKLETDPTAPCVIATERGVGYVFTLRVDPL